MNVIERIHELRIERNWSVNTLAMEAGLTQSTLDSVLKRNSNPRIDTIQCLCNAFGITLSQFFFADEILEPLTPKEKQLIDLFRLLPSHKQQALINLLLN